MAKKMTICNAVDAFELYDLFNEILDTYEADFYTRAQIDADLKDLLEENEDIYEFTPDENGEYAESLERNLKEALSLIFEEHGVEHAFDDEFMEDAMDDDEIEGIYNSEDFSIHEADDESGFGEEDNLF
ncbi:MAG: hypothetical protein MI863_04995 [Desulfobacterales bacterium]|nr:hypothetical protein [Desulfobacterales bacterium]